MQNSVMHQRLRYEHDETKYNPCRCEIPRKYQPQNAARDQHKSQQDCIFIRVRVGEAQKQYCCHKARPIEFCHALNHKVLSDNWQLCRPANHAARGIVLAEGVAI